MIDQKIIIVLESLIKKCDFSLTKDRIYNEYFTIEYKVDKDINFIIGTTFYDKNDFIDMLKNDTP